MSKKKIPILKHLLAVKNISQESAAKTLRLSIPTLRKHLEKPKRMTGFERDKLSSFLKLKPEVLDSVIRGEITKIEELVTKLLP